MKLRLIWLVTTLAGRNIGAGFVNRLGWNGNDESNELEEAARNRSANLMSLTFVVSVITLISVWI